MKHIFIFALVVFISMPSYCQKNRQQYTVGNFIISITVKNNAQPELNVSNKADPQRMLWQTVPGVALAGAAYAKGTIVMHGIPQGQFRVLDTIVPEFGQRSITSVTKNGNQLLVRGNLSGKTGATQYSLAFTQVSDNQLQFILHAGDPSPKQVNRLFLKYASARDEHVYGFGEKLTYFDQKGHEVPMMVQEHGIGRGLPLFTQLFVRFEDGGGGNPLITCAPAPKYITSKGNALFLEIQQYAVFKLKKSGSY